MLPALKKNLPLLSGPLLFLLVLLLPLQPGFSFQAKTVLATTLWMAAWWITESIPMSATALLPIVIFPVMGVMELKKTVVEFSNEIIFLFLGSFFIGAAIEKWGLHRRFALLLLSRTGMNPRLLLLGFMTSTAFVSMWISNTATAAMMLPIGVALAVEFEQAGDFNTGKALMLGIAYAAGIGGMATPVGTPTNAIFLLAMKDNFNTTIPFGEWVVRALPLAVILLLASWAWLAWPGLKLQKQHQNQDHHAIREQLRALGPMQREQWTTLILFVNVAAVWITGSTWLYRWVPGINDTVVSIAGALLLFILPAPSSRGGRLLDWHSANSIPWGILLLFGGGLALAEGFKTSGLANWLGSYLAALGSMPLLLLLLAITAFVVLVSEIASNVATAAMLMPILISLASGTGLHPYGLLFAATIAASCGVALPVATPPNAIVFGSGKLKVRDMLRNGIAVDIICIVLMAVYFYFVVPLR